MKVNRYSYLYLRRTLKRSKCSYLYLRRTLKRSKCRRLIVFNAEINVIKKYIKNCNGIVDENK